jgi:hypothetical protein
MPPECLEGINRMDLTLVSSNFTKEVIQNSVFDKKDQNTGQLLGQLKLEKPVEVLFEGIDLEFTMKKHLLKIESYKVMMILKEPFAFYS